MKYEHKNSVFSFIKMKFLFLQNFFTYEKQLSFGNWFKQKKNSCVLLRMQTITKIKLIFKRLHKEVFICTRNK